VESDKIDDGLLRVKTCNGKAVKGNYAVDKNTLEIFSFDKSGKKKSVGKTLNDRHGYTYKRIRIDGKFAMAHRVAYDTILGNGEIFNPYLDGLELAVEYWDLMNVRNNPIAQRTKLKKSKDKKIKEIEIIDKKLTEVIQ
jgi:hypothetical protein